MFNLHPLIDVPVTKYYFDAFIVGAHSSLPHLLKDLLERKELILMALSDPDNSLPNYKIKELNFFDSLIESKISTLDIDLKYLSDEIENAEPEYWTNRLGRQSALEISTYGRIRPETMNLLMLLPEDNFVAAMNIAGRLSNKIQILGESSLSQQTPIPGTIPIIP